MKTGMNIKFTGFYDRNLAEWDKNIPVVFIRFLYTNNITKNIKPNIMNITAKT
jgi:hypothetical protein